MTRRELRQRCAAAGVLALLTTYVGQQQACADPPSGRVSVVSQTIGFARLMFSAVGLPVGATVDPASVRVHLDGKPTKVTATFASTNDSTVVARRAVLVFDTSGSMAGAGIAGARRAALAFASSVPADVKVGLVAFADRPRLVLAPTVSRSQLKAAVDGLQAGGETSLYDGVNLALRVLGAAGERALVVLSDGADTRSKESLSAVTFKLRNARVRMDAVALHTPDTVAESLQHMAVAAGGQVTAAADSAGLASAFSAVARTFASEVTVNLRVPESDRGRTIPVEVTVGSSVGALHATTSFRAAGAPASSVITTVASPPPGSPHNIPVTLLLLVFIGLFAPMAAFLIALEARRSPQARTQRLLTRYTLKRSSNLAQEESAAPTGLGRAAASLMALSDRIAANPARREKLVARLARADVSMTPGEWIAVQSIIVFTVGVLATLMFGSALTGVLSAFVGFIGSSGWLSIKGRRRLRAFDEHLPASLQLVASSLRSGFSLAQALDGVVREGIEPIAGELNRALAEARLGMPIEDALDGIGDRMDSTDFRWVVMAIRIQREVGGNLAEILLNTAGVMRERARLRRQVRALSAEGRLSAYILFALPVLMAAFMFTFRRAYIRPLYTTALGIGMLLLAGGLLVTGALWMRKVVAVEV